MSKKERKTVVEKNYSMTMAGRVWLFETVTFTEVRGHLTIAAKDLSDLQRDVANTICGEDTQLNLEEFGFLCSISQATYSDTAQFLGLTKSAISKWFEKDGFLIDLTYSRALKMHFWRMIFCDISRRNASPADELKAMSERAVNEKAARKVKEKTAA
jgi:hypothetical protein